MRTLMSWPRPVRRQYARMLRHSTTIIAIPRLKNGWWPGNKIHSELRRCQSRCKQLTQTFRFVLLGCFDSTDLPTHVDPVPHSFSHDSFLLPDWSEWMCVFTFRKPSALFVVVAKVCVCAMSAEPSSGRLAFWYITILYRKIDIRYSPAPIKVTTIEAVQSSKCTFITCSPPSKK